MALWSQIKGSSFSRPSQLLNFNLYFMDVSFHISNNSDVHVGDTLKVHMVPHLEGEWNHKKFYRDEQVEVG